MTTALLVLDMLTDFTTGKLANPAAQQIVQPGAARGPRPAAETGAGLRGRQVHRRHAHACKPAAYH